jgi:hypothetical protein
MADIVVNKSAVFSGGDGTPLAIAIATDSAAPIPEAEDTQLSLSLGASAPLPVKLGGPATAKLSISANASAVLTPIWQSTAGVAARAKQLNDADAESVFTGPGAADKLLMLLEIGVSADASGSGSFPTNGLDVGFELKAGVDGSYRYARSFPKTKSAHDVLTDFLEQMQLPSTLRRPLFADEHLLFEFGGAAKFGVSLAAGYSISGSRGIDLGDLDFDETYAIGILGKVMLTGDIAGRFAIEVSPLADGFARVTVRKKEGREFGIGAQLTIGADFDQKNFPTNAKQLLEAILGLRSKNWINLFEEVKNDTDLSALGPKLDTLAKGFIEKWVGKAFEQLNTTDVQQLLAKIHAVASDYDNLGESAVTLFDHYFDPVANAVDDAVVAELDALAQATSFDGVRQRLLAEPLSTVLTILGGGDLLKWLQNNDLQSLKTAASKALSLIHDQAHDEIRGVIARAKSAFGLDPLFALLQNIDVAKIQQSTDKRLLGIAERLIGRAVAGLQASDLGKVVNDVHAILGNIDEFTNTLFGKVQAALKQSFSVALNAAYNQSDSSEVLLTVDLNLGDPMGIDLLGAAARGRFDELLNGDTPARRIVDGSILRGSVNKSSFGVTIIGWHGREWKFQSVRELVVNAEQHVLPNAAGGLIVTTDVGLDLSTVRDRNGERIATDFLLDFIGLTQGGATSNPADKKFLIDAITAMSSSYRVDIQDPHTTRQELDEYLQLAIELGLGSDPVKAVNRILPDNAGVVGKVAIDYNVRFTQDALEKLFQTPISQDELRRLMRSLQFHAYRAQGGKMFTDLAWAYWNPGTRVLFDQDISNVTATFSPIQPYPGVSPTPAAVKLQFSLQQSLLRMLYINEDRLVDAFLSLQRYVTAGGSPAAFAHAVKQLGSALSDFASAASTGPVSNPTFALFDHLIRKSAPQSRDASMSVSATLNDKTITGMLLS